MAVVPVRRDAVLEIAGLLELADLRDGGGGTELAAKLRRTVEREARIVALDDAERDTLLAVLNEPSEALADLRGALLREWWSGNRAVV